MIKLDELQNEKKGTRFDSKKGVWIGYRVDITANGKRHRPIFPTKAEAEAFEAQLRSKNRYARSGLAAPVVTTVRFGDLKDRRVARITNAKEIIRVKRVLGAFAQVLETNPPVTAIRKAHVQLFINRRLSEGVSPSTVDREVTIISTALHEAAEIFPLELESFEPPTIPRPTYKKGKKHRRTIEAFEKDAIIASILGDKLKKERPQRRASRPVIALMFEMAWLLGLRFTEVKKLRKADADLGRRVLRVTRWKTSDVSVLEFLPDRVVEILSGQMETPGEYVFQIACSDHTFAAVFRDACAANGIDYGRNVLDGVTFHSTRHSFTSRMTEVADMATTATFTGHSSKEMVDYYSHATREQKRRAMERMYGDRREEARKLYDDIRAGNLDFESFYEKLKSGI